MVSTCEVAGCDKPVGQARKCYMHFHRLRYHGSTDDPRRPWQETFWSHVDKSGECWEWTSATDRAGYGMFGGTRAPMRAAHRLSWLLAYGDPGENHVLHRCDNPPCVRPGHLFLGDDAVNHSDMASKKRSAWGERNAHAKLTSDQVLAIRAARAAGVLQRTLAERFGVTRTTISDIDRRHSWTHLD